MRRLFAICAIALLSACAVAPPQPLPQLTRAPHAFEISGRIAVRDGQRSDIAKLRWTRKAGGFDQWIISSPLGNEVARIDSTPDGATIVTGSEPAYTTSFPAVTERFLGVARDPDVLAGWIHGESTHDAPGGWKVTLDETQRAGAIDIAKRITASRGDVVVKLVVDQYQSLED